MRRKNQMETYELAAGPIGNSGVADICMGHYSLKDVSRYRDEHNSNGEFHLFLSSPVETLYFDMLLHKDLGVTDLPDSFLTLNFNQAQPRHERGEDELLPMPEKPRLLYGDHPALSTPLAERYNDMADLVYERLQWKAEDFRAWRLELKYPPLPTTLVISFPLQYPPEQQD